MASTTTGYITSVKVNSGAIQNIGSSAYGVCETAAGTAAKTVDMTGFVLTTGATIHVKFTNSNTAASPTLNVNGTGAKAIKKFTINPGTNLFTSWAATEIVSLTYDGTNWCMNDATKSGLYVCTCATAAATNEKVVTPVGGTFELYNGVMIAVKFTYTSTASAPKINVAGTGAKSIWINGQTLTWNDSTFSGRANYYNYYIYDGTYWVWAGSTGDNNSTTNIEARDVIAYCSTGAGTAAKTAAMSYFVLRAGVVIKIRNNTANTATASVTMNVNSTGAKTIRVLTGSNTWSAISATGQMPNGSYYALYDGTYWDLLNCGTAVGTGANNLSGLLTSDAFLPDMQKGYAIKNVFVNGYKLVKGARFKMYVQTTNTSATALQLNVNITGAKPLKINGTATSTTSYALNAGWYEVIYDGTNYNACTTASILGDATFKNVDTSISAGSTSTNLPTSAAVESRINAHSGIDKTGTVTSMTIKANSPLSVDSTAAITTSGTRTLSHANSGVTAGTYRSVTVNATGHVTAGTNPTTLAAYGITDASVNTSTGLLTLGSNTWNLIKNIEDGSASSIRGVGSAAESSTYTLGQYAATFGFKTKAAGTNAFAINYQTSAGADSFAQGNNTEAWGVASHAEGYFAQTQGDCSHAEGANTISVGSYSHTEGTNTKSVGSYSHAEGNNTISVGDYSHAEGSGSGQSKTFTYVSSKTFTLSGDWTAYKNSAVYYEATDTYEQITDVTYNSSTNLSTFTFKKSFVSANFTGQLWRGFAGGTYSHSEGRYTKACGNYSHAEGSGSTSIGSNSHAEGNGSTSIGSHSHAEGNGTIASAYASHSEGDSTVASGSTSHSEGYETEASGVNSHSEGCGTIANSLSQHVSGEYNIEDPDYTSSGNRGKYAEIIGNGTDDSARSNARTLDWNGNMWIAGNLFQGAEPYGTRTMHSITIPFSEIIDVGTVGSEIVIDLPAGYIYQLSPGDYTYPGAIGYYSSRYGYAQDSICGAWTTNPILTFDFYYAAPETLNHEAYNSYNLELYDHNYCYTNTISSDTNHSCNMFGGTSFKIKVKTAAVSRGTNPNNYILVYGLLRGNRFPYTPTL